ncbi:MAG: O-antigen ligase family protein [Planctomycetaceae bacterium]|nr:O-antigen ligase family protein [Planctomycetaceae bacterium]
MARAALALAFAVAGVGFLQMKIWEALGRGPILFLDLMLMLPAVLLGSVCWWKGRSYASRWPVILCIGLVWLSLFYPGNVERMRGFYTGVLLTIPLPLAALIVENRAWNFCAKVYVWANAAALVLALWFESRVANGLSHIVGRFGFLLTADGTERTGNPNQVGGQLAFAAVVAFIFYLKYADESATEERTARSPNVYLFLTGLLSVGCMLTASRGAFAAWLPAVGMLLLFGTGNLPMSRLKDLIALSTMGVLVLVALMVAGQATPWDGLSERFGNEGSRNTMAGRTQIWASALKAWQSDPDFIWRGTGIGMADDVLGQFMDVVEEDDQGVLRKNCHNAFVEWVLTLGLVGIVAGTCLAGSMIYQTIQLDRQDRNVARAAILLCITVFAMTAVSYRHECWPATGALALAMLTTPARRRREREVEPDAGTASDPALGNCHFEVPGNRHTIEAGHPHMASERSPHIGPAVGAGTRESKA